MTFSSPYDSEDQRRQALTEFAARTREAPRRDYLDRAAVEAIEALEEAGIEILLLKGAALAQTLYAPDRERGYFDVDLLVEPGSHASAGEVLARLGYRNVTAQQGIDDVADVLHAELWTRLNDTGSASIDLHTKLAGCHASKPQIWRSLRTGARVIYLDGRPVLALGDAGLALHAALHLAQHGQSDVKATADLKLGLIRWPPDVWEEAAALAREVDGLDAFSAGLRLIPEGEPTARALRLGSGDEVLWNLEHRAVRPRGTFHLEALAQATTLDEWLRIVRRSLFPAPNWIRWEMRWAARTPAHLIAGYIWHLSRAPMWAARARLFSRHRHRH